MFVNPAGPENVTDVVGRQNYWLGIRFHNWLLGMT